MAPPKTMKYNEVEMTGPAMLCMSVRHVRASSNP
jgi:hypothetical protein